MHRLQDIKYSPPKTTTIISTALDVQNDGRLSFKFIIINQHCPWNHQGNHIKIDEKNSNIINIPCVPTGSLIRPRRPHLV